MSAVSRGSLFGAAGHGRLGVRFMLAAAPGSAGQDPINVQYALTSDQFVQPLPLLMLCV